MASSARSHWQATAVGAMAIVLWATLALFTTATERLPPFQVVGITFAIASLLGAVVVTLTGQWQKALVGVPLSAWMLGVVGLFGYHALYFAALKNAPPADASLIAYLWPLLIVLFSALLPGERLQPAQVLAALLGLSGTVLLILQAPSADGPNGATAWVGYALAFGCALIWSGYSVLNRLVKEAPTAALMPICAIVSVLGFTVHVWQEPWTTPDRDQWFALIALGAGPVGLAFFVWDYGTKHGNLALLGVLAYAAPVLSTVLLVLFGRAAPSWTLALACALIVGGAGLASSFARRA